MTHKTPRVPRGVAVGGAFTPLVTSEGQIFIRGTAVDAAGNELGAGVDWEMKVLWRLGIELVALCAEAHALDQVAASLREIGVSSDAVAAMLSRSLDGLARTVTVAVAAE